MAEKLPLDAGLDFAPRGHLSVECVVNGPIQTNTYFAISGNEAVVIDPAWEGEELVQRFSMVHPDVAIKAIICTHAHGDHVGGVAGALRALDNDVPFLISKIDAPYLEQGIESLRVMWDIETETPPAPDRLLSEGDVVEFGDVRLQVLETPGHTFGGIVLFAATEDGNIAFVGDTLFPGGHGRCDLPGGNEADILRSLARMSASLPEDTLCYIGHNQSTTMAEERAHNPFMIYAVRHEH